MRAVENTVILRAVENTVEKLISTLKKESQVTTDWFEINEKIVDLDKKNCKMKLPGIEIDKYTMLWPT